MFRKKTWFAMAAFCGLMWCAAIQGRHAQSNPAGAAPAVTLSPSSVPFDKRESVHVFVAEVRTPGDAKQDSSYAVELTLYGPRGRRTLALKPSGGGKYSAAAQLLEEQPRSPRLRATVTLPDKAIVAGEIDDQTVKTLAKPIKLSEIANQPYQNQITLKSGEQVGGILGPAPVVFDIGGSRVTVDLARALHIEISSGPQAVTQVAYTLVVRKGKDEINRSEGAIALTGGAAAAPAGAPLIAEMLGRSAARPLPPIVPPQLASDRVELKLSAPADNIVVGAGGRYLFIEMHAAQRIAVFDVNTATITRYVAMPSSNFRVAAGADKLIVLLPDLGVAQRWNLGAMEREASFTLEATDAYSVALGYASAGPVLVLGRRGRALYDLDTFRRLAEPPITGATRAASSDVAPWTNMNAPYDTRASADGATFTAFDGGRTIGSAAALFFSLEQGMARDRFQGELAGAVIPSQDGSVFFTGSGILSSELRFIAPDRLRNAQFIPSTSPAFFLGAPVVSQQSGGNRARGQAPAPSSLDVFLWEDKRLVINVPAPELTPPASTSRGNPNATILPVERRVFLIPNANLLVTLTLERDTLIVRKLDLEAELQKTGKDYLYVESQPTRTARRGERYHYALKARSRSGGIEYKLESAPAGMSMDTRGVIEWDPPAKAPAESPVIVAIQDRSGQTALHAFTVLAR